MRRTPARIAAAAGALIFTTVVLITSASVAPAQSATTITFAQTFGTTSSPGTGAAQFQYPQGVAVDGSGNVYVADTFNHRVQKFNASGTYLATLGTTGA